jgi:aspartate kinase
VPDAKHLPVIDLAVLAEMAEAGAKVLNAQAVEWARRNKVAIVARKTSDPVEGDFRETVASTSDEGRNVSAIAAATNVMLARTSDLPNLLKALSHLELVTGDVTTMGSEALVHIPLLNVPDWTRCARELSPFATFTGPHAVVTVAGFGLTGVSGTLRKALEVLGAPPIALTAGPLRISATIDPSKLDEAQRALHAAFVA